MRSRAGSVVVLLLVLAPLTKAATIGGELSASIVGLPPGTSLSLIQAGAFINNVSEASRMVGIASFVEVQRFSYDTVQVGPVQRSLTNNSAKYTLTNPRLELTGGDGYVGIYPSPQTRAILTQNGGMTILPSGPTEIGNVATTTGTDANSPFFSASVSGPVLACQCDGQAALSGRIMFKIYGPEITLVAEENTTRESSGTTSSITPTGGTGTTTWIVLTLTDANLTIQVESSQFISKSATFEGTGKFTLSGAEGEIITPTARYEAQGEQTLLEGQLSGSLDPEASREITVSLQGNGEVTNLSAMAPSGVKRGPSWSVLLLGAAIAASTAAGAVAVLRRSRRARPIQRGLSVDECVDLANSAAEEERFQAALEWNLRAQSMLPSPNAKLIIDEGWYLAQLGEVHQALAAYEQVARLSSDGQSDFLSAVLLMQTGSPPARVVEHLLRALELEPGLVLELEDDPMFDEVRGDARLKRAIRDAQRHLD